MIGDLIKWFLGIVLLLLTSWGGVQKARANRAEKVKEKVEEELIKERSKVKICNEVHEIKDTLVVKEKEHDEEKDKVSQTLSGIPQENEKELSDEVKKLAADQSARARARAERLQNNRTKD